MSRPSLGSRSASTATTVTETAAPDKVPPSAVPIASLAALRILFGAALFLATVRFAAHGWIAKYWGEPSKFFTFWGLRFVHPWSLPGMYVHYALVGLTALAIAAGIFYRPACIAFAALFGWAHFADKTNYLNHYWFVTSMAIVLAFLPADRAFSLRTWRRPDERLTHIPPEMLAFTRMQVGVVYFFGGVAKLNSDWLFHAQPLTIWLSANTDFPVFGRFLALKSVAFAFSWCGALYDLAIVPALLHRRTRPFAYAAVLFFHIVTAKLFQIGIFPWVMIVMSPIFFAPEWPLRLLSAWKKSRPGGMVTEAPSVAARWARPVAVLAGAWVALQLLLPLREFLYPGNRLWTEEAFRFGWNVMLVEKNASMDAWTIDRSTGERSAIDTQRWLTPVQWKQMSTQPDMLLEYAHWVREDAAQHGHDVSVHFDVRVAWNGRASAPLVDSRVDLGREADTLAPKRWILPAPAAPPEW